MTQKLFMRRDLLFKGPLEIYGIYLLQPLFFDILKKTQGPKNSKLKKKTQNSRKKLNNSRKKLKVWASFKDFVLIRLNFSNKHPP